MFNRVIIHTIIIIIVSFYLFPITFAFLPEGLNTKNVMALLGVAFFSIDCLKVKGVTISKPLLGALVFAVLFSFICFYSTDYNNTIDYSYANYVVTFFVWLGGAYSACKFIAWGNRGNVDLRILTYYLATVCVAQCIIAILMDRFDFIKIAVDSFVVQGQEFMTNIDRLYGIGAALDPAGTRFSTVLVLIAGILSKDSIVKSSKRNIAMLSIAFFIITIIGNMISRTTLVGASLGLFYIIINTGVFQFVLKREFFKFHTVFGGILFIIIGSGIYLYNTDENFYSDIRFAFEGFFNWYERGEWSTSSTDKLNNVMWIWPEDTQTWIIGSGLFGSFIYSTDIGYCRFILYCGIVGFSVFSMFFIYNGIVFMSIYKKYWDLFLVFIAVTFIIWIKVSTDIFYLYALLYCIQSFKPVTVEQNEDILLDT